MREELLIERLALKVQIKLQMDEFMKETDTEKAREQLSAIKQLCSRVEKINWKLAHEELRNRFEKSSSK